MAWVGEEEDLPKGRSQLMRRKIYTCRGCAAGDVRTVVVESRKLEVARMGIRWKVEREEGYVVEWETVKGWMEEAKEEWKKAVPESYAGRISDVDMDEAWELLTHRKMTKEQFGEWLDQRAWDKADEGVEEMKVEEEATWADKTPAQVDAQWERFTRRRERGVPYNRIGDLDKDSDAGDALTQEIDTAMKEVLAMNTPEPPLSADPAPTEDLVQVYHPVHNVRVPRRLVDQWRGEPLSSAEEGELADDEGSWTKEGYAYNRRVRFERDDGGCIMPIPILTGDLHEDDRRIKLATDLFKGLPIDV